MISANAQMHSARRGITTLAIVVFAVTVASCGSSGSSGSSGATSHAVNTSSGLHSFIVAAQPKDHYSFTKTGDTITVHSSDSTIPLSAINEKRVKHVAMAVFWEGGQPGRLDSEACVSLDSVVDVSSVAKLKDNLAHEERFHAPGVALRIDPGSADKPSRTIVVSQVLVAIFEVSGITSSKNGDAGNFKRHVFGAANVKGTVGDVAPAGGGKTWTATAKPPPWKLCARVLGTTVSFVVWPGQGKRPSWNDSSAVHTVNVPKSWVYTGYSGGFESGLGNGNSSQFTGLKVTSPY